MAKRQKNNRNSNEAAQRSPDIPIYDLHTHIHTYTNRHTHPWQFKLLFCMLSRHFPHLLIDTLRLWPETRPDQTRPDPTRPVHREWSNMANWLKESWLQFRPQPTLLPVRPIQHHYNWFQLDSTSFSAEIVVFELLDNNGIPCREILGFIPRGICDLYAIVSILFFYIICLTKGSLFMTSLPFFYYFLLLYTWKIFRIIFQFFP